MNIVGHNYLVAITRLQHNHALLGTKIHRVVVESNQFESFHFDANKKHKVTFRISLNRYDRNRTELNTLKIQVGSITPHLSAQTCVSISLILIIAN